MNRLLQLATRLICLTVAFVFCADSQDTVDAAIVFNEALNGDFSDNNLDPTEIGPLELGRSTVVGSTDGPGTGPDIFSVEVVAGTYLTGLFLEHYENLTQPTDRNMFLAVDDSATFPDDYFEINNGNFSDTSTWLAGSVVGVNEVNAGTNIINLLAKSGTTTFIGTGFEAPLGEGTYTFYLQQTRGLNDYTLSFVTAVPEPTTSVAMLGGLIAIGVRRYRKNRKTSVNVATTATA
jgi:hypothetical protein